MLCIVCLFISLNGTSALYRQLVPRMVEMNQIKCVELILVWQGMILVSNGIGIHQGRPGSAGIM